jgi:O-antigen biosynthesis protein
VWEGADTAVCVTECSEEMGLGAGVGKDSTLANLTGGRALDAGAVLRTIHSPTPRRVSSQKIQAKYRRGRFKAALSSALNSAMRRAYPLVRDTFSKLPSPARRVFRGAVRRLGWTAALSVPPQLGERTPYQVLSARFAQLNPIHVYRMPETAPRVTLVTDSVNAGSLDGGVGTAMIFCALLASRLNGSLRVVTRTERPNRKHLRNVLTVHGAPLPPSVEFVHADVGALGRSFDVRKSDIFVTTSWWTTCAVKRSISAEQIVQIIQEDERMFYPYGDERLLCHEALSDASLRFVVNSRLLFEHFSAEGLETIVKNGVWFEPAFPAAGYYSEDRESDQKLSFVFYAQPQHIGNLYHRGLEAIDASIATGILDPDRWDFTFVGAHLEELTLADYVRPTLLQNLEWAEYLRLMRTADLGLALMYTPHPSYPPLDLAACGAVAVTNKFGPKAVLENYSRNIICSDLNLKSLLGSLSAGTHLAQDRPRRLANYQHNSMSRSWEASLKNALDFIVGG